MLQLQDSDGVVFLRPPRDGLLVDPPPNLLFLFESSDESLFSLGSATGAGAAVVAAEFARRREELLPRAGLAVVVVLEVGPSSEFDPPGDFSVLPAPPERMKFGKVGRGLLSPPPRMGRGFLVPLGARKLGPALFWESFDSVGVSLLSGSEGFTVAAASASTSDFGFGSGCSSSSASGGGGGLSVLGFRLPERRLLSLWASTQLTTISPSTTKKIIVLDAMYARVVFAHCSVICG